ncbi:hypothetical protein CLV78_101129 [Aliiruegeria haliotis]|uniref:Uncharacterized protein n=1 Tax=Aliiruegeria haliotis TaxID=1280846 RepID=A0A2T0RXW7_9RHOB|nr:hypothetical protein [Aliiruegeria haliotis]PRY26036.1 hypothetical protein CLV78_101129 [Aliiruegeria haliotis]
MKQCFRLALVALLCLGATSAVARMYWAENRMQAEANPARDGVFEVFQKATAGPSDYWCAAGDFVRWKKGQAGATRVYVMRGMGPSEVRPGRTSVIFTYVKYPEVAELSAAEQGYSVSISKVGYNLRASHGYAMCRDSIQRFRGRGLF